MLFRSARAAEAAATAGTRAAEAATAAGAWAAKAATAAWAWAAEASPAARTGTEPLARWPRRSILTRPCFADRQVAALEGLRVEPLDDLLRLGAIDEFHERKAARPAGLAIDRHDYMGRLCDRREVGFKVRFCGAIRQVPDEQTDCQGSLVKDAAYDSISEVHGRLSRPAMKWS